MMLDIKESIIKSNPELIIGLANVEMIRINPDFEHGDLSHWQSHSKKLNTDPKSTLYSIMLFEGQVQVIVILSDQEHCPFSATMDDKDAAEIYVHKNISIKADRFMLGFNSDYELNT